MTQHRTPDLAELEAATVRYTPPPMKGADKTRAETATAAPTVELLPGTAFSPEDIRWIWRGWIAEGKLHLLAGGAGTGKTTAGISFTATVTTGGTWPDGSRAERGSVLIWSGEDSVADTLLPRLLAAGGDPTRVHFVGKTNGQKGVRPFDPAVDMAALAEAAQRIPDLKLAILDPVVSAVAGDSHKNGEVRRGLQPVVDFAEQSGCAVLGITHFSKNTGGREPLERVVGSLAFGAVARLVMATVKPAEAGQPRRLVRAKSNIGPDGGGYSYDLFMSPVPGHDFAGQWVEWGEALEGTARDLMAVEERDPDGNALASAKDFLSDALSAGPMAARDLKATAEAHDHSWASVRRAKKDLAVKVDKDGLRGGWLWSLPPKVLTPEAEDAQQV